MVTPLPRRRPQILARETASLDVLSDGRLILGVGPGSGRPQEWANFNDETDLKIRAKMTDEALDVLTGLWSGEPFEFEGNYYSVSDSQFLPRPVSQPRIPIWIGGYYPHKPPMRRAAKWDGMFMLVDETEDKFKALKESLEYIQQHRDSDAPFDMIYLDQTPDSVPSEALQESAHNAGDAGATWWIVNIDPRRYGFEWDAEWDFERMRQTILEGPPR